MKNLFFILAFLVPVSLLAQTNLLDELNEETEEETVYTRATFKGTRIVNSQSVETVDKGVLQFMISHRFGELSDGPRELWGLDNSQVRLALNYGITDWLQVGIGRTSTDKTFDGSLKFKLLRQSSGKRYMPVSIVGFTSINYNSQAALEGSLLEEEPQARISYAHQLIVARKFNSRLSLQVAPMVVHRNVVQTREQDNDIFVVALGGRYKLTNRLALNVDFIPMLNQNTRLVEGIEEEYLNSLSVGVDIETGGHVFQLHVTNSRGMYERAFATETFSSWTDGDLYFGFNISRVFTLVKPKEFDESTSSIQVL